MNTIELKAETRTTKGNGPARVLRRDGRVPAVLYGPKTEPSMLSVSTNDLEKMIQGGKVGRSIINLVIDGGKQTRVAMVKELQIHPLKQNFLHIDLYEIAMDRKIRVHVPINIAGKAQGIEMGGMLQIVRRELEVLCLPGEIPSGITVDVTELGIGDAIHVEDIKLEGNVEIPHDTNFTILTISAAKAEVGEGAEGVAAEAAGEPQGEQEE